MSELGDPFAGDQSISAAKIDAKSFAVMTGTKIGNVSAGQSIAAAIPTSSTGGFTVNVPVFRKTDNSGWLPFFHKHLHSLDTDEEGGTLYNIRKANAGLIIISSLGDNRNMFYSEVSGTGAAVTDNTQTGYSNISITAGSTNGGYATAFISTVKISFASPIFCQMKLNETVGTSILTRLGVGIEKVQNTTDNTQKIGIEGCDSDGTNFRLLAADGTARSKIDGLTAIATSTKTLRLNYTPGASLVLEAAYGGTVATLTTNVPSSGALANENQLFRAGVKSTTTTARIINLFGMQLLGKADTSDWF